MSKCVTTNEERRFLRKILGEKTFVISLLYRGSEHGWYHKDFKEKTNDRGPSISLYRIRDGDCFGGFSNIKWSYDG